MQTFLDMALYGLALFALVYFIYSYFFSGTEEKHQARRQANAARRFERREPEKGQRRRDDVPPPEGVTRNAGRRTGDQ